MAPTLGASERFEANTAPPTANATPATVAPVAKARTASPSPSASADRTGPRMTATRHAHVSNLRPAPEGVNIETSLPGLASDRHPRCRKDLLAGLTGGLPRSDKQPTLGAFGRR